MTVIGGLSDDEFILLAVRKVQESKSSASIVFADGSEVFLTYGPPRGLQGFNPQFVIHDELVDMEGAADAEPQGQAGPSDAERPEEGALRGPD